MLAAKSRIITHRGLDPSKKDFFSESSLEAFTDQLNRGFGGIEFDPNPAKDGIVVLHDATLDRPTGEVDKRPISELTLEELATIKLPRGTIPTFDQIMTLIREHPHATMNALHLKSRFQTPENLKRLLTALNQFHDVLTRLIIFDVKPETARLLKRENPHLRLAPSVAHSYDIKRFNDVVGGTLLSIDEALQLRDEGLIDGVWGDEWDRSDENDSEKKFYTKANFDRLKSVGLFIALVTPELHGTSPGLYGGESHPDAKNHTVLIRRIKQIIQAGADYLCTDYPDDVLRLL